MYRDFYFELLTLLSLLCIVRSRILVCLGILRSLVLLRCSRLLDKSRKSFLLRWGRDCAAANTLNLCDVDSADHDLKLRSYRKNIEHCSIPNKVHRLASSADYPCLDDWELGTAGILRNLICNNLRKISFRNF